MDGCVVQLRGGDPDKCEIRLTDPMAVAEKYARYGELAVIDLDAALGRGDNIEVIERITARLPARVGGGIRDHERADRLLRAGATKLIVGTRATPDFLGRYPRDRMSGALDSKRGKVVPRGWTEATAETPVDRARALAPYCDEFLFTVVDREGAMGGTDIEAVAAVVAATDNHVTAAGGITTIDEVVALDRLGASCQLGMAIYTGRMDLSEAWLRLVDWGKSPYDVGGDGGHGGLLPVVVSDAHGQVIMHAWTDRAGARETLETGRAVYFSRSRGERWEKGATSGHTQAVSAVRYDCDRDTLLYRVAQRGNACHVPDRYSCFGPREFGLSALQDVLRDRLSNADEGSYTRRLFADPALLRAKLIEEADELVRAESDREVIWETADVIYFALCNLVARGLSLEQVEKELYGRHGRRRAPKPDPENDDMAEDGDA